MLTFDNEGPLLVATNYFSTEQARAGKLYVSTNAGCVRLLVPQQRRPEIEAMVGATQIVVSTLSVAQRQSREFALEWMAEQGDNDCWDCLVPPEQLDSVPQAADWEGNWTAAVYVPGVNDTPELLLELPAHLREVSALPCLEPFVDPSLEPDMLWAYHAQQALLERSNEAAMKGHSPFTGRLMKGLRGLFVGRGAERSPAPRTALTELREEKERLQAKSLVAIEDFVRRYPSSAPSEDSIGILLSLRLGYALACARIKARPAQATVAGAHVP